MQWWLKMAQGTTRRYKRRWMVRERGPGEANGTSYTSNQEYVKVGIKSHNIMIIGDQKQRQRIFHFQIRHVWLVESDTSFYNFWKFQL